MCDLRTWVLSIASVAAPSVQFYWTKYNLVTWPDYTRTKCAPEPQHRKIKVLEPYSPPECSDRFHTSGTASEHVYYMYRLRALQHRPNSFTGGNPTFWLVQITHSQSALRSPKTDFFAAGCFTRDFFIEVRSTLNPWFCSRKIYLGSKFSQKCVAMILLSPWNMSECVKTLSLVLTNTKHAKNHDFYLESNIVESIFGPWPEKWVTWSQSWVNIFVSDLFQSKGIGP